MNVQGSDFALARKTDGLVEATATTSAPEQPAASTDVPAKPNCVTSELANVFTEAGGTDTVLEKQIGYVEKTKVRRLQ